MSPSSLGAFISPVPQPNGSGTVEAATPEEAFVEGAEKFKQPRERLMAVERS